MCGGGHAWWGACIVEGIHGRGMHGKGVHGRGVSMAGVCVWQRGMHGRGTCMVRGMCGEGACMAGDMATAVDGTHPTGMHSYFFHLHAVFSKIMSNKNASGCDPSLNFPLGYGPGPDPPQFPPWVWAWT